MIYKQIAPRQQLSEFIKSVWLVDCENDNSIQREKIIPDGFPEMIFHYKDPYKSNINGSWRDQRDPYLIAGQIRNYFYLENTGYTGMFAVKFQPWALKTLFNVEMKSLTDQAVKIPPTLLKTILPIKNIAFEESSFEKKVKKTEDWLINYVNNKTINEHSGQKAVELILENSGKITIDEILSKVGITERSLERYFSTHIGVSPKFYCRIIRFSNIFKLVSDDEPNWAEISQQTGFYDQSHFIKNFKEFTGEEPSNYGFTNQNMANLFLK